MSPPCVCFLFLVSICYLNLFSLTSLKTYLHILQLRSRNLGRFDESCTALIVDMYEVGIFLECETPSGMIYEVPEADENFIAENFENGPFVLSETDIVFPSGSFIDKSNNTISSSIITSNFVLKKKKNVPTERKLIAAATVTKSVLVVCVIASDGSTTANEATLSDGVLGTNGDPVNLKSQYADCSQGQLNFEPAAPCTGITNRATTVTVTVSKTQGDVTMRKAISAALNTKFGVTSPTQIANHVMYCLPPGTMSGIAYAFINSWMSVYIDDWCGYASVQLHEIGHNLGLAHSNENGEYEDQSGMVIVLIMIAIINQCFVTILAVYLTFLIPINFLTESFLTRWVIHIVTLIPLKCASMLQSPAGDYYNCLCIINFISL